jgi:hypothetical protein
MRRNFIAILFLLKADKVSREIASSEVEDLSILREAQKELGIK